MSKSMSHNVLHENNPTEKHLWKPGELNLSTLTYLTAHSFKEERKSTKTKL